MAVDAVRSLVMRYGWNSTAYQILNPGMEYWWPDLREGVVGFVRQAGKLGRTWVAAGAPVCERSSLTTMTQRFEAAAAEDHCRVCYFCAGERLREVLQKTGEHAVIGIGAQPVWDPRQWPDLVRTKSGIRAQLNRAKINP